MNTGNSCFTSRSRLGRSRHGKPEFTLIELLAIIGIIAILAAMLLPSLSLAKEKAHAAKCPSTVRQMSLASMLYAGQDREVYPWTHAYPVVTLNDRGYDA